MTHQRMCWTCGIRREQSVETTPSGQVYLCSVCGTTRLVSAIEHQAHPQVPPPHSGDAQRAEKGTTSGDTPSENER